MIRGKRLISLLLTLMLCLGLAIQVNAADLSDTKKKAQELEEKKKAAEGERAELVIGTEKVKEYHLKDALRELKEMENIYEISSVIREY